MYLDGALAGVLQLLGFSQHVFEHGSPALDVDPEVAARLPVANATRSYWTSDSPLADFGSTGNLTSDADVCIIGSGITGISAAYHLSRLWADEEKPLRTVVFEARDFCSGATGRNGGHLTPDFFQGFRAREVLFGVNEAKKCFLLEQETVRQVLGIIAEHELADKVDLVSGGHVHISETTIEHGLFRWDFDAAQRFGLDVSGVEWLTSDEVWEEYGASLPGALGPGHNVWPLKLVTELFHLANASRTLDLQLHTRTPVTALGSGSDGQWTLQTPRGRAACTHVLHASNAYAPALLPALRGPAGIVPVRAQIIATRAAVPARGLSLASFDSANEYWFPRPVADGAEAPLVILGGAREFSPTKEVDTVDDASVSAVVGEELRRYLPYTFPGMYEHGLEPEMEWTGIMGYTQVHDPFVGPVRSDGGAPVPGQWIAAGFSGHGMPRTYLSARAVAEMLVANVTGEKWTPPAWFPAHYLRWPTPV